MSRILTASALALALVAGLPAAAAYPRDEGRSYRSRPGEVSVEGVYATGSIRAPQAAHGRTAR